MKHEDSMMKSGAKKYFDGAMHQAGEETIKYESANGGQQVDDAKAAVQVRVRSNVPVSA